MIQWSAILSAVCCISEKRLDGFVIWRLRIVACTDPHHQQAQKGTTIPIENEPITAEKIRRKKLVAVLGKCLDCGQPVKEEQEFSRLDDGIRHKLCVFDPAFAKRVRELELKAGQ
jgi:hypothetical protein